MTAMSDSIQFNSDGTVFSMDGDVLNKAVQNPSAMSDHQKANIGIQTSTKGFASFNTGVDAPAQASSGTVRVQLLQPTNRVAALGTMVEPEVLENLMKMAPEAFEAPATKQAEAKAEADTAKAEEISREELNRHPGEIEGYHQHITGEVSQQSLISLMVYAQRGETPPASLISNIARDMGETVDNAVAKVNLVNQGVQAQFTILARSMNLDADKAADWLRDHRKDTSMAAIQAHYLRRDLQAWKPLLEDYRAATGDGRAH
jgi:hypothetical protein